MMDPKRLIHRQDLRAERLLLRSDLDVDPPEAAQGAVWNALAVRLAAGGAVATVAASANATQGAGASALVKSGVASALYKTATVMLVAGGAAAGAAMYDPDPEPRHTQSAAATASTPARVTPALAPPAPTTTSSHAPVDPGAPRARVGAAITPRAPSPSPPPIVGSPLLAPSPIRHSAAAPDLAYLPPAPSATTEPRPPSDTHTEPAPDSVESAVRLEGASVLDARGALRRGDCAAAVSLLDEADARFPKGTLRQERDALRVEALACAGRLPEAAARAEVFLRAYPSSPYSESVRRFVR